MDTVGRPSPTTPLTNPAIRKTAAMRMRSGSIISRTLTEAARRHNLKVTETAFVWTKAEEDSAMRFDLVDLQLFIAVADQRSITRGARAVESGAGLGQRAHQRARGRARRRAAQARAARCRADRGGREPARSCTGRHAPGRCHARRSRRLCQRRAGECAFSRQHLGAVGASAEGAGGFPARASRRRHRHRGAREHRYRGRHHRRRRRSRLCRRARAA